MRPHAGLPVFMPPGSQAQAVPRSGECVRTDVRLPARLEVELRARVAGRPHAPPALAAALVLPEVRARVTFRSRPLDHRPQPDETARELTLVPDGTRLARPLPSFPRRVGRGRLSLRALDPDGRPLGGERPLLERPDGARAARVPCLVEVGIGLWIAVHEGADRARGTHAGPWLEVWGDLRFTRGITLRFALPPPAAPRQPEIEAFHWPLVPPGRALRLREHALPLGPPHAPWVAFQVLDPAGAPLGEEHLIGRCLVV